MESSVCKNFCAFYKPGKEVMKCGSFEFLQRNLTGGEVRKIAIQVLGKKSQRQGQDKAPDNSIRKLVCSKCDFLKDGCDYRAGLDSPPCGGYAIMAHLLEGWDRK